MIVSRLSLERIVLRKHIFDDKAKQASRVFCTIYTEAMIWLVKREAYPLLCILLHKGYSTVFEYIKAPWSCTMMTEV